MNKYFYYVGALLILALQAYIIMFIDIMSFGLKIVISFMTVLYGGLMSWFAILEFAKGGKAE